MLYLLWLWTPCYREQRHWARPVVPEMCCLPPSPLWGVTERVQTPLGGYPSLIISMVILLEGVWSYHEWLQGSRGWREGHGSWGPPRSCLLVGWLWLAAKHPPSRSRSAASRGQGDKIGLKSLWVEMKAGTSLSDYHHGQNGLYMGKTNLLTIK